MQKKRNASCHRLCSCLIFWSVRLSPYSLSARHPPPPRIRVHLHGCHPPPPRIRVHLHGCHPARLQPRGKRCLRPVSTDLYFGVLTVLVIQWTFGVAQLWLLALLDVHAFICVYVCTICVCVGACVCLKWMLAMLLSNWSETPLPLPWKHPLRLSWRLEPGDRGLVIDYHYFPLKNVAIMCSIGLGRKG